MFFLLSISSLCSLLTCHHRRWVVTASLSRHPRCHVKVYIYTDICRTILATNIFWSYILEKIKVKTPSLKRLYWKGDLIFTDKKSSLIKVCGYGIWLTEIFRPGDLYDEFPPTPTDIDHRYRLSILWCFFGNGRKRKAL